MPVTPMLLGLRIRAALIYGFGMILIGPDICMYIYICHMNNNNHISISLSLYIFLLNVAYEVHSLHYI